MSTGPNMGARLAAIGLLLAVIAALALAAALPYARLAALDGEMARLRPELAELTRRLADGARLQQENRALRQDQSADLLLPGAVTGVAGANLQKRIAEVVAANNGHTRSIQVLPPKRDGDLTQIAVSLAFQASIAGLREILFALETGTPLLFVDELAIHGPQPSATSATASLQVTMQVSGYIARREVE